MGSTIIHSRLMLRFVQCAGRVGSMGGSTSAKSRPTRIMMTGLRNIHMASRLIDQARAIDNRRLKKRLGHLPPSVLAETKEKLRRLTDL